MIVAGAGAIAAPSNGCGGIDNIKWETPLDSFLQAETVESLVEEANNCSLKNLNSDVIAVVQGEQSKGLSPEAFSYNNDSPLNERSQKLIESMSQMDESAFSEFVNSIQAAGDQHRYDEAHASYTERLKEYERRYNKELCPAVNNYNSNVYTYNNQKNPQSGSSGSYNSTTPEAFTVRVTASYDSPPSLSGTPNSNVPGASKLNATFDDCVGFYYDYVVPAKDLHDKCSKSEYVTPKQIPEYEFSEYPQAPIETSFNPFEVAGRSLASLVNVAGATVLGGALNLVEGLVDGLVFNIGGHLSEDARNFIAVDWGDWLYDNTALGLLDDASYDWGKRGGIVHQGGSWIGQRLGEVVGATVLYGFTGPFGAMAGGYLYGTGTAAEDVYQTNGTAEDTGNLRIYAQGVINGAFWGLTGATGTGVWEGLTGRGISSFATTGRLGAINNYLLNGSRIGNLLSSANTQGIQIGSRFSATRIGGAISRRFHQPQHLAAPGTQPTVVPNTGTSTTPSTGPKHMAPNTSTSTTTTSTGPSTTTTSTEAADSLPDPTESSFFDTPPEPFSFPDGPQTLDDLIDIWGEKLAKILGKES